MDRRPSRMVDEMARRTDRVHLADFLLRELLLGAAYYATAQLSLRLALVDENVTPLWPPTGIAVVAFVFFGSRLWPAVAVAALLVNLPISSAPWAAATTAVGNTLAPIVAAVLLARAGFRPQIERLRDALVLVPAALVSTLISATVGAGTLVASDAIDGASFPGAWSVWWAGDAMGILVVAPFLLTLPFTMRSAMAFGRWAELVALLAILAVVCSVALTTDHALLFAVVPVIGWISWRFQQAGAAPAALLVSAMATWAAVAETGPFAGASLFERMLTLQAFNASVAMTSFVFAALVTERARTRDELQAAAHKLERRVARRTEELTETNRQLAEAEEVATIGSWEWDVPTGHVRWSDELYRMHGFEPQAFPMTFEAATEPVEPEDRDRIRRNLEHAFERGVADVPEIEYRISHRDGSTRRLVGKGRLSFGADGAPARMVGTVQDVTEVRELERDHRIAEILQRAMAPPELPTIQGVDLAARYIPAEEGSSAGGDWYDAIVLPSGAIALVIGDVAGHGLEATSVMGQIRTAIRAYALDGLEPGAVVGKADRFLRDVHHEAQMVTLLYTELDLDRSAITLVNAGHPPPIVLPPHAPAAYLRIDARLPIGVGLHERAEATQVTIEPGSTLVLYTDGLVDRPGLAIDDAFDRLLRIVEEHRSASPRTMCDAMVSVTTDRAAHDDIAVLAAALAAGPAGRLALTIDSVPSALAPMRRDLARWLSSIHADGAAIDDLVLACSEACSNAIEHAYGLDVGAIEVQAELADGSIVVAVRDRGRWREGRHASRGRGLGLIHACVDRHTITHDDGGTVVTMKRALAPVAR